MNYDSNIGAIKLTLDDCRRLTGKSLLWEQPGSILDAFVNGIDKQQVVDQWSIYVKQLLIDVNWATESTCFRIFEDGVSLAISAPMDALYAACEINETAWNLTHDYFLSGSEDREEAQVTLSYSETLGKIKQIITEELNPNAFNSFSAAT
jgi:cyanophycin synthetase